MGSHFDLLRMKGVGSMFPADLVLRWKINRPENAPDPGPRGYYNAFTNRSIPSAMLIFGS